MLRNLSRVINMGKAFRLLLLLSMAALLGALPANALEWALNKQRSRISFEADAGGQIVTGTFQQFEAEIRFDPEYPDLTDISARIDVNTINTGQPQADEGLRSADWFDAQSYPFAGFRATSVEQGEGEGRYLMTGELSIKSYTKPVTIPFTLTVNQGEGTIVGEAAINRRNFGIGPSGPVSGVLVGDLVKIRLDLVATRLDN